MTRTRGDFGRLVFVGCFALLCCVWQARAGEATQAAAPSRTAMSGFGADFVRYPDNPWTAHAKRV